MVQPRSRLFLHQRLNFAPEGRLRILDLRHNSVVMPKLFRVLVPVPNIDRAAEFYEAVLDLPGTRVSPGRHYFDCDGTILACYDPFADGDEANARPLTDPLSLSVEDLDDVLERAREAGAVFASGDTPDVGPLGEIAERPWGERSFYCDDPFGNPLCFVEEGTEFTGSEDSKG